MGFGGGEIIGTFCGQRERHTSMHVNRPHPKEKQATTECRVHMARTKSQERMYRGDLLPQSLYPDKGVSEY